MGRSTPTARQNGQSSRVRETPAKNMKSTPLCTSPAVLPRAAAGGIRGRMPSGVCGCHHPQNPRKADNEAESMFDRACFIYGGFEVQPDVPWVDWLDRGSICSTARKGILTTWPYLTGYLGCSAHVPIYFAHDLRALLFCLTPLHVRNRALHGVLPTLFDHGQWLKLSRKIERPTFRGIKL